ncbi:MAG: hypothetical protein KA956_11420 [Pyrinomonadaceae bacterium]|nr:hypothetical protein [Pyrinomonadaceae bacterium]
MKLISQKSAFSKLDNIRTEFRATIRDGYEHRAKSCVTCETPGACCLDAHFVNVRISRLEAESIKAALLELPLEEQKAAAKRTADCIETYKLDECLETESATYACPLFEKGTGCLVHSTAKPLPCIEHACYGSRSELPPDELLETAERRVYDLNLRTFGQPGTLIPIPIAISTQD